MSYTQWVQEHGAKHKKIITKLLKKNYSKEQIIDYFDFENMREKEPDFCPLYKENKKCHEIEELNCYLCSCPNFRFKDAGIKNIAEKRVYSLCSIDSKDGAQGVYGDSIHQDCSKCTIPHHKNYVEQHFSLEWDKIMKECIS